MIACIYITSNIVHCFIRKETKKHKCLKTAKTSTKPGTSKKTEKSKKAVPSDKYETRLPIHGILTQFILYEEDGVMKYRRPGIEPQAKGTKRKGSFPDESSSCSSRKRKTKAAFNEDNLPDSSYAWSDKDNCYHHVGDETRLPIDGILTQLILYEENGVMKYRRPGSQPQAKGTKRKGRFPYESSSCSSRKRRSHAAFNEDNFPDGSYVWSDKDNCYHDVGGIPEDWSSESVGYNFDESDTD
ncbi:uncharacterized protein [Cherax quadricarinatus]|uniref:uncharacterized protein n=1 Tax=Cherax quadricarinatus TaxID=27406 RepID=UPI00387E85E8